MTERVESVPGEAGLGGAAVSAVQTATEVKPSLGIWGRGRLGRSIAELAGNRVEWALGSSGMASAGPQVVIDASAAEAAQEHVAWALAENVDLVLATTGWHLPALEELVAERIGVVLVPNGSVTVALLERLVRTLGAYAEGLDDACGYLYEHHHSAKRDAPSGTARLLQEAWRLSTSLPLDVCSQRAGFEIGTHRLGVDRASEVLEIRHSARSRSVFAEGVLLAADWVFGRRGVFRFSEVVGSRLDAPLATELTHNESIHDEATGSASTRRDLGGRLEW